MLIEQMAARSDSGSYHYYCLMVILNQLRITGAAEFHLLLDYSNFRQLRPAVRNCCLSQVESHSSVDLASCKLADSGLSMVVDDH